MYISEKVEGVIYKMLSEGWEKDTNMHGITMTGKIKFEMWRMF